MAQFNLGVIYATGQGVPEDPVEVYAWFSLAAAQGVGETHVEAVSLAGTMTDREAEEARILSRELWNAYSPGRNTQ